MPFVLIGQMAEYEQKKSVKLTEPVIFSEFDFNPPKKIASQKEDETINGKSETIKSIPKSRIINQTITSGNAVNFNNQDNSSNQFSSSNFSEINWFNSYTNSRNEFLKNDGKIDASENEQLNQICSQSNNFIPSTFYNNFILLKQNRNNNSSLQYLKNAQKLDPQNTLLLSEVAWIAERNENVNVRNQAIVQMDKTGGISELSKLNAALIVNALPEGSLLITNGEFDTYPLWLVIGNRKIFIISLAMIADNSWLISKLKSWNPSISIPKGNIGENELFEIALKSEKPVFTTLSLRKPLINKWSSKLFVFGNFTCLSNKNLNNVEKLKNFYFHNPFMEQLISKNSWQSDAYLPALINFLLGIKVLQKSNQLSNLEKQKLLQIEEKIKLFTSNVSNK